MVKVSFDTIFGKTGGKVNVYFPPGGVDSQLRPAFKKGPDFPFQAVSLKFVFKNPAHRSRVQVFRLVRSLKHPEVSSGFPEDLS